MGNNTNTVYYAIITYIIIIIFLFTTKPLFMYDHKNKKFKEFGFDDANKKTIFSLEIVLIISAILLYIFFSNICENKKQSIDQIQQMQGGFIYCPLNMPNLNTGQFGLIMPNKNQ